MFSNNLLAGVSGQGGAYSIEDSLRFNDNDSAYLSRTPSVAGDRKTWTWSGWVKRGNLGSRQFLFTCADVNAQNSLYFEFSNNDEINIADYNTNWVWQKTTTGVFRDVSGWYHIVLRYDTTESTASDRIKLYVNGAQVTAFGTNTDPSLNYDGFINTTTNPHRIGSINAVSLEFDGYMAEVNFIDGQALTADDFGEIDETTGEWSPKKYSGTYGTNGFYLPFNGNANDDSGNGNNWTENNLASTDYMIDTPTNNFSVLNPLAKGVGLVTLEGNTELTATNSGYYAIQSSMPFSSGKWYMEFVVNARGGTTRIGGGAFKTSEVLNKSIDQMASGWFYGGNGLIYNNNSAVATVASYAVGDIIGLAFDADSGTLDFYKNGGSSLYQASVSAGEYCFGAHAYNSSDNATFNFGADSSFAGNKTRQGNTDANGIGDFYYTPPTGYLALCTDNLPAPAIEQPETHFNVVTYTGNGGTQSITGVGFQPDFVWAKLRTTSSYHRLHDVVRGSDNTLASNVVDAEVAGNGIVSFDSDGFTMDSGTNINQPYPYVAWCWKAGGTAVTNTDGSVNSQVSANVDAGFSIVEFNPNLVILQSCTVGHGLSQAPELIITKSRTNAINWWTWTTVIDGSYDYLALNTTAAKTNDTTTPSAPTSSVFSMNYAFTSTSTSMIAYCFHSVEGFSKIGTYVGNGSADGPFVYTGFRPAFVMIKRTDSAGNAWYIWDNELNPYNADGDNNLWANNNNAENTNDYAFDGLSDGFKIRATTTNLNASAGTYIYMAFAEHPLNYSTGR